MTNLQEGSQPFSPQLRERLLMGLPIAVGGVVALTMARGTTSPSVPVARQASRACQRPSTGVAPTQAVRVRTRPPRAASTRPTASRSSSTVPAGA